MAVAVVVIHTQVVLILGCLVVLLVVAVTCLAHKAVELEIILAALHAWDILAVMVVLLQHTLWRWRWCRWCWCYCWSWICQWSWWTWASGMDC